MEDTVKKARHEEFKKLIDLNGDVSPESLIEAAKDIRSFFHDDFDWSNTVAAHKWRLHQARCVINSFTIEVKVGSKTFVVPEFTQSVEHRQLGGNYSSILITSKSKENSAGVFLLALKTAFGHLNRVATLANILKVDKEYLSIVNKFEEIIKKFE